MPLWQRSVTRWQLTSIHSFSNSTNPWRVLLNSANKGNPHSYTCLSILQCLGLSIPIAACCCQWSQSSCQQGASDTLCQHQMIPKIMRQLPQHADYWYWRCFASNNRLYYEKNISHLYSAPGSDIHPRTAYFVRFFPTQEINLRVAEWGIEPTTVGLEAQVRNWLSYWGWMKENKAQLVFHNKFNICMKTTK